MSDMLAKLYDLKALQPFIGQQEEQGIRLRRALAPEKYLVLAWIKEHFGEGWANEADIAYSRIPSALFIAQEGNQLIGFACYDAIRLGFFGPTGVGEAARGRGTGTALLMVCLHDMQVKGYGYAIIGDAGPTDFYTKICGATIIPDSYPGVYAGLLRPQADE